MILSYIGLGFGLHIANHVLCKVSQKLGPKCKHQQAAAGMVADPAELLGSHCKRPEYKGERGPAGPPEPPGPPGLRDEKGKKGERGTAGSASGLRSEAAPTTYLSREGVPTCTTASEACSVVEMAKGNPDRVAKEVAKQSLLDTPKKVEKPSVLSEVMSRQ